ncbi:FecR family protein [Pseudomonas shirazensis]|uniref:FecR family protein n=1 Tax=Pseudomonas shirazensis TaxID=2745494 RepID=UPI003D27F2E6
MSEPRRPGSNDPLTPFELALRNRVPSREALLAEGKAQTVRQRRRKQVLGASLSTVALASMLWGIDPAWRSEDVRTAYGQRHDLQLADGSRIALNSATHLRIEQRLRSRQFELLEGEATFTVAPGDKPFIVRSQGVAVRDISTVFNVRSDSRGVAVAVIEGAVDVSTASAGPQRLLGGQQLMPSRESLGAVAALDPASATAWQQGKLRFDGTPLREVLAEIRRYRQAPIRLADNRLGDLRLSGEFDSAAVESLIDLLPAVMPVMLIRGRDGSVLVSAR